MNSKTLLSRLSRWVLSVFPCFLVVLFGIEFAAQAQTPTPTPPDEPNLPPSEALPPQYQPSAYDTGNPTILERVRFVPTSGGPTWPAVLLIHPGGFHTGDQYGPKGLRQAAKDLIDSGYLVFSVDYRLAPPDTINGQPDHSDPTSGRPPQQSNDIKQQVLAARNDSQCNGTVFAVGGSAGGTHAVWAALDPAQTVPGWNGNQLVKAAVSLSGAYDFSDWRGQGVDPDVDHFIDVVTNYTNKSDSATLKSLSPVALVTSSVIKPLFLITSESDPMPPQEWQDMLDTLSQHGVPMGSYQSIKILGSALHAFDYWHSLDAPGGQRISKDVIDFLNAHLN